MESKYETGLLARSILLLLVAAPIGGRPEAEGNAPVALTADQIVERMVLRNQQRTALLRHYTSLRHYQVQYRGFPVDLGASMDVEATYNAPASKSFRTVSQSGSKILLDHVLKKLLETERNAAEDQSKTALTPENYSFALATGEEQAAGHSYVLEVSPRVANKLLYRGRIWVDATDFAVTQIDAEPAKNPSFWITKTEIRHAYAKTGDFWLPERNRSESAVRGGGTAILTITYGKYQLAEEAPHDFASH